MQPAVAECGVEARIGNLQLAAIGIGVGRVGRHSAAKVADQAKPVTYLAYEVRLLAQNGALGYQAEVEPLVGGELRDGLGRGRRYRRPARHADADVGLVTEVDLDLPQLQSLRADSAVGNLDAAVERELQRREVHRGDRLPVERIYAVDR